MQVSSFVQLFSLQPLQQHYAKLARPLPHLLQLPVLLAVPKLPRALRIRPPMHHDPRRAPLPLERLVRPSHHLVFPSVLGDERGHLGGVGGETLAVGGIEPRLDDDVRLRAGCIGDVDDGIAANCGRDGIGRR